MTERPQFCEDVECPYFGGSVCYIKRSINTNWYSTKRRKREVIIIESMAKEDPKKVIDLCDRDWTGFTE